MFENNLSHSVQACYMHDNKNFTQSKSRKLYDHKRFVGLRQLGYSLYMEIICSRNGLKCHLKNTILYHPV